MLKNKVKILKEVLGDSYRSREEYLFYCPSCKHHKKKLSVNLNKNKFKCWICDYKGNSIGRLIRRWGSFTQQEAWSELAEDFTLGAFDNLFGVEEEIEEKQVIELPEAFRSLATTNGSVGALPAKRYLKSRGITQEDILKWKIGYCSYGEYEGRIIIPSFNEDGDVNYFIARTYDSNWKKYMNPPSSRTKIIFNELYLDWSSDLSIVEGAFDAIIAGNGVPILGSTLSERHKLFNKIVENDTPVYIALDPDVEIKALKLIKKLIEYDVEVYKVDIKGYDDVGSMTKEEYQKRKSEATLMNSSTFLDYAVATI